jgi:hypothetical protein
LAVWLAWVRMVCLLGMAKTAADGHRSRGHARRGASRGPSEAVRSKVAGQQRELALKARLLNLIMNRIEWCTLLLLAGITCVHAEDQPSNQRSALPWLKLDALTATRDRPLFSPDRRKPAPPPPPRVAVGPDPLAAQLAAAQAARPPDLTLTGIITDPMGTLILLRRNTSEVVTMRSGETVDGPWRVLVDSNYSVKLADGKKEFKLEMFAPP